MIDSQTECPVVIKLFVLGEKRKKNYSSSRTTTTTAGIIIIIIVFLFFLWFVFCPDTRVLH